MPKVVVPAGTNPKRHFRPSVYWPSTKCQRNPRFPHLGAWRAGDPNDHLPGWDPGPSTLLPIGIPPWVIGLGTNPRAGVPTLAQVGAWPQPIRQS